MDPTVRCFFVAVRMQSRLGTISETLIENEWAVIASRAASASLAHARTSVSALSDAEPSSPPNPLAAKSCASEAVAVGTSTSDAPATGEMRVMRWVRGQMSRQM